MGLLSYIISHCFNDTFLISWSLRDVSQLSPLPRPPALPRRSPLQHLGATSCPVTPPLLHALAELRFLYNVGPSSAHGTRLVIIDCPVTYVYSASSLKGREAFYPWSLGSMPLPSRVQ